MKRLQLVMVAVSAVVIALVFAMPARAIIQSQQAQISIDFVVQVVGTPIPVGFVPNHNADGNRPIISSIGLRRASSSLARTFRAEALRFDPNAVAQAQVQNSLLVQAKVTPNPKATILVSNVPAVVVTAAPGQTVSASTNCTTNVTINMTGAWALQEGVTSDFDGNVFPGKDLANNTYLHGGTPQPAATPYIVYADDGSVWSAVAGGGGITEYCVNLTVTVPASVPDNTYQTNIIYTLFN